MKNSRKVFTLFFMALAITLSSCSKDGEAGPPGMNGVDGANAQDGQDGQDGNANVVSVLLEDQTLMIGINEYNFDELTQSVFDNGVVLGYVKLSFTSFWETLPLSLSNEVSLEIDKIFVGSLELKSTFDETDVNLRFIFIDGTSATGKGGGKAAILDELKNAGVDIDSYEQVKAYYNLQD